MLYQQPQSGPLRIDSGNPICAGLIYGINGANQNADFVGGRATTPTNSPPPGAGVRGVGPKLNGTNQSIGTGLKFTGANGTILLLALAVDTTGTTKTIACQSSDDGGNSTGLGWQAGNFYVANNGAAIGTLSGELCLAGTWGAGGVKAYVNGALTGSNVYTGAPAAPAGNFFFELGCFTYSGGRVLQHANTPYLLAIWNRALSPQEVAQLSANPWQVFIDQDEEDEAAFFAVAVGGVPTGTFATTLAATTMSASGAVVNGGAFASALAGATMTAAGAVGTAPTGTFASTLSGATMAAAGAVANVGTFAATLAGAAMSAAGIVTDRGTFVSTLAGATMVASGVVVPNATGTFSSTLAGATMAAYGYNGVPPVLAGFFQRLPKNPRHVQRIP